jgi:hypothetical protein
MQNLSNFIKIIGEKISLPFAYLRSLLIDLLEEYEKKGKGDERYNRSGWLVLFPLKGKPQTIQTFD